MAPHPRLQYLYEQAELAMSDCDANVTLSLLWRKGDQAIMQAYESIPEGGLPNADAAVLYLAMNNESATQVSCVNPAEETQWRDVYFRLKSSLDERHSLTEEQVAITSWDPPAPSSRSTIRRKMGF